MYPNESSPLKSETAGKQRQLHRMGEAMMWFWCVCQMIGRILDPIYEFQ